MSRLLYAGLLTAALHGGVLAADDSPGGKIFQTRCASCHEGTLGPRLAGIVGRRAGTGGSGVHSRAMVESGIVWSRSSLRRFLSDPAREVPGTIMPVRVEDPKQLEVLLDYLETLR
jgi:cytochrome c